MKTRNLLWMVAVLASVMFGIGFAMHLGGPLYYGRLRGWDRG